MRISDKSSEEESSEPDNEVIFDPARGEGIISSSSENEVDGDSDDSDDDKSETKIRQDDNDVVEIYPEEEIPQGEETHRFAVVNLDWDNVNAADLMKLFCGFKLEGSIIKSVRIYPSQFGKERLEKVCF